MTIQLFYAVSLAFGLLAYVGLTLFCIVTWSRGITGRAAFLASFLTLLFLTALGFVGVGPLSTALKALGLMAWITLLVRVIGVDRGNIRARELRPVLTIFAVAAALTAGLVLYAAALQFGRALGLPPASVLFTGQLLLAICGLALLEQVVRNTRDDLRWRLRYLNIGLGTLFAYQLLHNACGLLFNAYVPTLLVVQPAVFALVAPFVALASLRNAANPLRLNLSRRFVFGSGVLMATGVFLLGVGLLGYLARLFEGDWTAAALLLTGIVATVATVTVLGSTSVRAHGRRFVEEHLLPSRYDYRAEWRQVTEQLTEPDPDFDLPQQSLRSLGRVLRTNSGAVWRLSEGGVLVPLTTWHTAWNEPLSPSASRQLVTFFQSHEWVLDLNHLPPAAAPVVAECQSEFEQLAGIRFLVPLLTAGSRLFGVAGLSEPSIPLTLDWEDYSLLKLIGRQSAGFIALREAERELSEAERLNSFNQMSAFVVHDLKTASAQLSLMLENAQRHKTNPEFIDDMLATADNAVQRMQKLLGQLREGGLVPKRRLSLSAELEGALQGFARHRPRPRFVRPDEDIEIEADGSQLRSAIGHLVQNAIDAVNLGDRPGCEGAVSVTLKRDGPWAEIVIDDNGSGMARRFVEKRLFQPFSSTKGVGGMGVGAYQSRSYARSLGGDVSVDSAPGRGSRFTMRLPVAEGHV